MEYQIEQPKKYAIGLVLNTNNRGDLNKLKKITKDLNDLYDLSYSYLDPDDSTTQYNRYRLKDVPQDIELYVFLTVGPLVHEEIRVEIAKNVDGQACIENCFDTWIAPGSDRTEEQIEEQMMERMKSKGMEMYWMINLNTGVGGNILNNFQEVVYG